MNQANLQFQIDQLRKEKIIYATEAAAVILATILGFSFSETYLVEEWRERISFGSVIVGIGYMAYVAFTNYLRMGKIKNLENKLKLERENSGQSREEGSQSQQ